MQGSSAPCTAKDDAYHSVCIRLERLCPRLVPAPLWGLSLAKIARLAPQAALAICDSYDEVVEEVHEYWAGLDRSGKCEVCGRPGGEVDEDWLYCVLDYKEGETAANTASKEHGEKGLRGIAYLARLRLLCGRCHLAKHQGYALVHRKKQEALGHLAEVNQLSIEETEEIVNKAFQIHSQLSGIRDWTIRIGSLPDLDEKLRARAEELLNTMYRKGFSIEGTWLYYSYPEYSEKVEPRVIEETMQTLSKTVEQTSTTDTTGDRWINSLLETIREELEPKGIQVLDYEFRMLVYYLLEDETRKRILQTITETIARKRTRLEEGSIILLLDRGDLTGKWMTFVPPSLYPRVFRHIVDALEESKTAYMAKILARRKDYHTRKDLPIIVYVPSLLATRLVAEVAIIMKSALRELYIERRLFFKPDIFTEKGIYAKRAHHKPYIYTY